MNLIKSIKGHEGFKQYPYIDPVVAMYPNIAGISKEEMSIIKKHFDKLKVTFGYGFTFITEEEALLVLQNRIKTIKKDLYYKSEWVIEQPQEIQDVLVEMAYQIGVNGLLKFKKTLALIKQGKYKEASIEMLDSKWAKQTPRRAKELSERLSNANK
jgi:lysozyme